MSDMAGSTSQQLLVTRPEPQATEWVRRLERQGVSACALPLLHIAPAPQPELLCRMALELKAGDLVMFVSPNAVLQFFLALQGLEPSFKWPDAVTAACTGPGSAEGLRSAGVPLACIVQPAVGDRLDSESLWNRLKEQPWAGRTAWIVRGEGGRDWLAQQLASAGADVRLIQGYARGPAIWNPVQRQFAEHAASHPDAYVWLLSSGEAVDALPALLAGQEWGRAFAFATHPRIEAKAFEIGFGRVTLVSPDIDAVCAAWCTHEP